MTDEKKMRTPAEQWRLIEEQGATDEMTRIKSLSEADLDAEIRADGGDPDAIGQRGVALVERLLAQQAERAMQAGKLAGVRAKFEARASRPREKLPRAEILARIERARRDPRFAQPVTVMFRNKTMEEASDDELEALLVQIETLAEHDE